MRPGYGLPPKYFDEIIGKTVSTDIAANTPVRWEVFQAA
ncbi:SAF domain-containing protein [Conchiformibius steedae]|nr:SAF domain-containing protein [Conchiformibius steedae]